MTTKKRSKAEWEELSSKLNINEILDFMLSMKINPRFYYIASWERQLMIDRAKELHIKGMEEFLDFGDYSHIGRRSETKEYRRKYNKRACHPGGLGRGIVIGSVALPRDNTDGGGFVYRESKKNKRSNSSKINSDREI